MDYAQMQNALTSTNMNVRKHFIKCAIPYICIEKCVQNIHICIRFRVISYIQPIL